MRKHWTEPNGIFIMNIPIEWQYKNVCVKYGIEECPYSFEPYDNAIGCFQISCYPIADLTPEKIVEIKSRGKIVWTKKRMDSSEFNMHLYFGSSKDQAIIGKYIYPKCEEQNSIIHEQFLLVEKVLESILVIPQKDRMLATKLDKYDRFLSSLTASCDLLYAAIESESYIEIVVVSANQIDAYLRLGIVLIKQNISHSDEIELKYLYQDETDKGLLERQIFEDARKYQVISEEQYKKLSDLYNFRNRIIHRYIISKIKTIDMIPIIEDYLTISEEIRMQLRKLEEAQIGKDFGIYGHGFVRSETPNDEDIEWLKSIANDKHLLDRFKRKIGK
jgi:hypothetical protein